MGLAATGLAEEEDRPVLLDEPERGQVMDQLGVDGGLELEVEVGQGCRNGKRANRRRAASLRLTVADACSPTTRARNSMWLHSWAFASSARVAKHSAERLSPSYLWSSFICS